MKITRAISRFWSVSFIAVAALAVAGPSPRSMAEDWGGSGLDYLEGMASGQMRLPATGNLQTASSVPGLKSRAAATARPTAPAASGAKNLFTGQGSDLSEVIVGEINGAQDSIQAALYELDLPNVGQALLAAFRRGVKVQIVMDYGTAFPGPGKARDQALQDLIDAGVAIRVLKGFGSYGIMHNKFAVYDGKLLETGSYNWTQSSNVNDYNNIIVRTDAGLVASFQNYWNWMWNAATPVADAQNGVTPPAVTTPPAATGSGPSFKGRSFPSCTFSPNGGTTDRLVSLVNLSQNTIDIAMFAFTSKEVAQALVQAQQRGVAVRLLQDRSEAPYSQDKTLMAAGIPVRILAGISGKGVMHDKVGIFDGEMVETGSFNYSENAQANNFENAVYDAAPPTVAAFEGEFNALFARGTAPTEQDLTPPSGAPHAPWR